MRYLRIPAGKLSLTGDGKKAPNELIPKFKAVFLKISESSVRHRRGVGIRSCAEQNEVVSLSFASQFRETCVGRSVRNLLRSNSMMNFTKAAAFTCFVFVCVGGLGQNSAHAQRPGNQFNTNPFFNSSNSFRATPRRPNFSARPLGVQSRPAAVRPPIATTSPRLRPPTSVITPRRAPSFAPSRKPRPPVNRSRPPVNRSRRR